MDQENHFLLCGQELNLVPCKCQVSILPLSYIPRSRSITYKKKKMST